MDKYNSTKKDLECFDNVVIDSDHKLPQFDKLNIIKLLDNKCPWNYQTLNDVVKIST